MISSLDIAWLAGLLEGEGCFSVSYSGRKPRIDIQLQMTDEDVVNKACLIAGIGNVRGPIYHKGSYNKPTWTWAVGSQKDVSAFIMTVYKFMGMRRQQKIRECLTIWKSFPYREQKLCPRGHPREKGMCSQCKRISKQRSYEKVKWDKLLGF